jgi:hypothetical protein
MSALQVRRMPVVDASDVLSALCRSATWRRRRTRNERALRRISTRRGRRSGTPSTVRAAAARDRRPRPCQTRERTSSTAAERAPVPPRRGPGARRSGGSGSGGLVFARRHVRAPSAARCEGGTCHSRRLRRGWLRNYGETFGRVGTPERCAHERGRLGRPDDATDGPAWRRGGARARPARRRRAPRRVPAAPDTGSEEAIRARRVPDRPTPSMGWAHQRRGDTAGRATHEERSARRHGP